MKSAKIGVIDCSGDVRLTQQSAKDECDINMIVESAKRGADISHLNRRTPMYGDFRNLPDYREALDIVNKANAAFMSMDAFVRERFANDPARMIEFLQDPKNRDEAVRLGLVNPPPVADPPQPKADSGTKKSKAKPEDE